MADRAGVLEATFRGLNGENHITKRIKFVGATSSGDTITTTITDLLGKGWVPISAEMGSYGAGAVGARTYTRKAVTITSFVETTGVLVVTTGADVTDPTVHVIFAQAGATPV